MIFDNKFVDIFALGYKEYIDGLQYMNKPIQLPLKYIPLLDKAYNELLQMLEEDLMGCLREAREFEDVAVDYIQMYQGSLMLGTGAFVHYNDERFTNQLKRSAQEYISLFQFQPNKMSAEMMGNIDGLIKLITHPITF